MTLSTTTSRVSYAANGATLAFAIPFKIFASTDVKVSLRDNATQADVAQTLNTHFTLSVPAYPGTGNVVFVTAPPATKTVVIEREVPETQDLDLVASGAFAAENVETQLDKIVAQVQQLRRDVADLPIAPGTLAYHVTEFGAKCDGTTEDHVAVQAAIDAAASNGGVVQFPAGTCLIGATLTLPARVALKGVSRDATVIKAKNGLNADLIKTANHAALVGQNKYLTSDGVPYGFGIEALRLDGNAANQTSGNGLVVYGKRYTLKDVMIANIKGIGWMSEGHYNVGTAAHPEQPESLYANVDVQTCGSHGIQYRGPADAVWLAVFSHDNAGWGVRFEGDGAAYQPASDARFLHVYANTAGGVFVSANTRMRFGHLATESNFGQGLVDQSFGTTYDCIEAYTNCRTAGTHQIELSGSSINVTKIFNADGLTGKSAVLSTGGANRIASGMLIGDGSGGTGLTVSGPNCEFRISVLGYSGTGGIGAQFGNAGVALSGSQFDLVVFDCRTGYTNVASGFRNAGRLCVRSFSGQALVGTDFSSSESVDLNTLDGAAVAVIQRLAAWGTSGLPGMSFAADRDTGFYRAGSDTIAACAGGADVARFIGAGGLGYFGVGSPNLFASPSGAFPLVQINKNSGVSGMFVGNWSSAAASAPQIVLAKSKSGTVNTFGGVANNDVIGEHWFVADDGDQFIPAALVRAEIDGTPGNNDMPSRLVFATTADGAQSVTERLRITQAGVVELATGELRIAGDQGGASGKTSLTNSVDLSANSTGAGTIKFKGTTSRDSAGFIKAYIGTTAYYIPVFSTITG